MDVAFTPQFRRQFKKIPSKLQEETLEKIGAFSDIRQHASLHVHKLAGRMDGRWSFSVNYRYCIVFTWERQNKSAILLAIGDHSIYE